MTVLSVATNANLPQGLAFTYTSPILEFRTVDASAARVTAIRFTGAGANGAMPPGSVSQTIKLRLYNNYYGVPTGVSTACNVTFASYDNTSSRGAFSSESVVNTWLQIKVLDYDGETMGADSDWVPIGGLQKHLSPLRGGFLYASGSHYLTLALRVVVPTTTPVFLFQQGLWAECTWI